MEIFDDLNLVLQLNQHIQAVSINSNEDRSLVPAKTTTSELTSFKRLTTLESVNNTKTRKDAQFDHQNSTFLSVNSSDLPYHLQGDIDFNVSAAMKKRKALRLSEIVMARIKFIWEVAGGKKQAEMAQCTRFRQQEEEEQAQQRDHWSIAENEFGQLFPPIEALDEQDYTALMLLIFKVLRDDFVSEIALKQIQCDWEVDSQHEKSLTYDKFFSAIFELVDVWTCDMEEITYDRFLDLLARRITQRVLVYMDGTELKFSLSDNFEYQIVVKAIPLQTVPKFVSVARVVAAIGMTTVGELVSADPTVIERSRIEFIQRNSGHVVSKPIGELRKIGQDLQTLLEMFKSIAFQYENSNYALEKTVLRKMPNTVDFRSHLGESSGEFEKSGVDQSQLEQISAKVESDTAIIIKSEFGKINDTNLPQNADDLSASLVHGNSDTSTIAIARLDAKFDSVRDATGNYDLHPISIGRDAREDSKGCLKPIDTMYDLQLADARVINALRSTFIIAKAISIKRQTELPSILNELVKFGVDIDVTRLPEKTIRDRYDTLYDLLVVREGESLKSLAAVILEQIKVVLSIHGITVDDEEAVEKVYDGFFKSVLTGTGDSIIEAARSWVQDTIRENRVNDYIKHDYHELTSIDEIKTLGTDIGDEEFLALLTNDKNTEDKKTDAFNAPSTKNVVSEGTVAVDINTPTVHNMSTISLDRALAVSVDNSNGTESRSFDSVKTFVHREHKSTHQAAKDVQRKPETRKYKETTMKKVLETPLRASNRKSSIPKTSASIHSKESRSLSKDHHYENLVTISQNFKPLISTQSGQAQAPVVAKKAADESSPSSFESIIETTDTSDVALHNDAKRNRPKPNPRYGRLDTESKIDTAIGIRDHRNISEQHAAPSVLDVANMIEEDDTGQNAGICIDLERSVSMEPKMPQIIISGATSARNIPITGRYIQLLGLGTVVITKDERELFDLLQLRKGLGTDLVCFDIGTDLDTAVTKLQLLQHQVGNRVILFGGNKDEPDKTQQTALECLAHGALYFATIPLNFPRLRESIMSFFENSKQPYILRHRKAPAQAAQVGRKFDVAASSLPSLSMTSRENFQSISHHTSKSRQAEFTPIAPDTPRSLPLRHRPTRFLNR